jgi:hypothetical protein
LKSSTPASPRPDSVDALVTVAERLADDERARTTALTTRGSTLAGFGGTILSVVAVLGREAFKLDLGEIGDPLEPILFLTSLAALAFSAALGIGGVLRGRPRHLIETEAVWEFSEPEWEATDPTRIKHLWLGSLGRTLDQDRANNARRAVLIKAAAIALLFGILAVAAQAMVLGIDQLLYSGH